MSGHPVHECQHLSQVLTRWHDFFCMRLCAATLLTSGILSNSLCEITTRIHKLTYVRRGPTDSWCLWPRNAVPVAGKATGPADRERIYDAGRRRRPLSVEWP